MSPHEYRAWLTLWGMGPVYLVYFTLQLIEPPWLQTSFEHLGCFAAASLTHLAIFVVGLAFMKRERGQGLSGDERDQAIDARATRAAYHVLMGGAPR